MIEDRNERIRRLSRAARPSLLEAACEPDLLAAMVLANLMSPSLWDFRDKIRRRTARAKEGPPDEHVRIAMREIHDYLDKHLFHVSPPDVEAMWGLLDLDEERERLGAEQVDYAMDVIRSCMEARRERGILTEKQNIFALMDAGRFPDYEYSTLDLIRAHRRHLKRKKHKPIGVTSCADEAVLSASLAWAEGHISLSSLIIFGSPHHYGALVNHRGHVYWFNGKREYFDAEAWSGICNPGDPAGVQDAFEATAQGFDRIITPFGVHKFYANESTLDPKRLGQTHETLVRFFGSELKQMADARKQDIRFLPNPMENISLEALDQAGDAASARTILKGLAHTHPGTTLELARYAFRDLWVEHPQAYLEAATRGHLTRQRAAGITSVEEGLDVVRGIAGEDSIFDDPDRIAMPDEALLFGTGTHRDKALLLYTLLLHAPFPGADKKERMRLVFTERDAYVGYGDTWIGATALLDRPDIGEPELLRLP